MGLNAVAAFAALRCGVQGCRHQSKLSSYRQCCGNDGDREANVLTSSKLSGNCFAGRREQLEPVKQRRKQRVANLTPQLAQPD
jgi:hypothetical protein